MDGKDAWRGGRCLGSTTVGPRGQVVIPSAVRKELDINTADTLLVFLGFMSGTLLLLKADVVEQLMSAAGEHLASVEKELRKARPLPTSRRIGRKVNV